MYYYALKYYQLVRHTFEIEKKLAVVKFCCIYTTNLSLIYVTMNVSKFSD